MKYPLMSAFERRITHLPEATQATLKAAYRNYLAGHIPEGYAALGLAYAGQSAAELLGAITRMSK